MGGWSPLTIPNLFSRLKNQPGTIGLNSTSGMLAPVWAVTVPRPQGVLRPLKPTYGGFLGLPRCGRTRMVQNHPPDRHVTRIMGMNGRPLHRFAHVPHMSWFFVPLNHILRFILCAPSINANVFEMGWKHRVARGLRPGVGKWKGK